MYIVKRVSFIFFGGDTVRAIFIDKSYLSISFNIYVGLYVSFEEENVLMFEG